MAVGSEVFGEDYLHFYETWLTDEVSDRQAERLWRLLELEPGRAVLDLACGHGRIANRLAARGASVTGLDNDPYFLERGRADAAARGVEVEYVAGDMRELSWTERFDAALLWFTSFGYFDDETSRGILRSIRAALRGGGRLVVDVNHLPAILSSFQRQSFVRRGADVLLDEYVWHSAASVMETRRVVVRDGAARELGYDVRMFMPAELRDWLLAAGFRDVTLLGEDGEALTPEHRRLVALAEA